MTAWIVVTVVSKSLTSWLIETFITDWSSTMRNCAVAKATSAAPPLLALVSITLLPVGPARVQILCEARWWWSAAQESVTSPPPRRISSGLARA